MKSGFSKTTANYISNGLITYGFTYTTEAFYNKYVTDDPNKRENWSDEAFKMAGLTTVFQIGAMTVQNTSYDIIQNQLNKKQKLDQYIHSKYNYNIGTTEYKTEFQYKSTFQYNPPSSINMNFNLFNPRVIRIINSGR